MQARTVMVLIQVQHDVAEALYLTKLLQKNCYGANDWSGVNVARATAGAVEKRQQKKEIDEKLKHEKEIEEKQDNEIRSVKIEERARAGKGILAAEGRQWKEEARKEEKKTTSVAEAATEEEDMQDAGQGYGGGDNKIGLAIIKIDKRIYH